MKVSVAKEKILKKIRQALSTPVPVPFPQSEGTDSVFPAATEDPALEFAENFTGLLGKFSFCSNESELVQQLNTLIAARKWENIFCQEIGIKEILQKHGWTKNFSGDLPACNASITSCECLVARTGSIMLSSIQQGRTVSIYAPVH